MLIQVFPHSKLRCTDLSFSLCINRSKTDVSKPTVDTVYSYVPHPCSPSYLPFATSASPSAPSKSCSSSLYCTLAQIFSPYQHFQTFFSSLCLSAIPPATQCDRSPCLSCRHSEREHLERKTRCVSLAAMTTWQTQSRAGSPHLTVPDNKPQNNPYQLMVMSTLSF